MLLRKNDCVNHVPPAIYDMNPSFVGGFEAGYNWQPNPFLLLGLENKIGYLHINGSYVMNPPPLGNGDTTARTRVGNWYDALTARVGAVSGQLMFFAEGGGVWTRVRTGVVDTTGLVTINTTTTKNVAGWAAGVGFEYAFNPNWSVKAEYLVLGINDTNNACVQVGGFPPGTIDCNQSHYGGIQTINLALNYRFH